MDISLQPIIVARAETLFASPVPTGTTLTRTELDAAIAAAIEQFGGVRQCAAEMAAAYGDRPETAAARMRWALRAVRTAPQSRGATDASHPTTSGRRTSLPISLRRAATWTIAAGAAAAVLAGGAGPAAASPPPATWFHDTGIDDDWNGRCRARTVVEYHPARDQAVISTTVTSPYLFAACRVHAKLQIRTRLGSFPSAVQYSMACAVFDSSCASTRTFSGDYLGASPALTAMLDIVNEARETAGLPPERRAGVVTGISLTHVNAG